MARHRARRHHAPDPSRRARLAYDADMGRPDETHLDYSEVLSALAPLPLRTLCFIHAFMASVAIFAGLDAGMHWNSAVQIHHGSCLLLYVPAIYYATWTRVVPVSRLRRVGATWTIVAIIWAGPSITNQLEALRTLPQGEYMLTEAMPQLRMQASFCAWVAGVAVLALLRPTTRTSHDATPPQA